MAALVLRDSVPTSFLLTWLGLMSVALAIRFALRFTLNRRNASTRLRLRAHVFGAALSGAAWGLAPTYFAFADDATTSTEHIFIACIITATSAAALPSQCWYRPVFIGYLLSATVALSVAFFMHGDEIHTAIAVLVLLMIVVLLMTARQYGGTIVATLRLQNDVDALGSSLAAARDELALAKRNKWQTLSHLSHELRTPMNAILGFSEVLSLELHGPLGSPKYRDYTRDIHTSGTQTMSMIGEILELTEAETGTLSIDVEALDLFPIVADAVNERRKDAIVGKVRLEFKPPGRLPLIDGDRRKLRQVFDNVLGNAIRFTPLGGCVSVTIENDDASRLAVRIADSGIGMDTREIARALEPFGRLDDPMTRNHDGLGLGLPLARRLVELHRGDVRVESVKGYGTTVIIDLPCGAATSPDTLAVSPSETAAPDLTASRSAA